MTSPGYTPSSDEKKGIFVHTAGSAYGSDLTEASVRQMAMGKNSNSLAGGLGGLLSGILGAIGGVISGIGEAIRSAFGPSASGTLSGSAAAAFEALKPMIDEVMAAKEFVEQAIEKAEAEQRETMNALRVAVAEVEKMRIDGEERRKLAQLVAQADTESGKLGNALAEALRLLSLANSRSLDQNEEVDQAQQQVLQQLAETTKEILAVQRAQAAINSELARVDKVFEETKVRFLLAYKNAPTGLRGYLQAPTFHAPRANIDATGSWSGKVVVFLRASNGAVDFQVFDVRHGNGSLSARPGGLALQYDAMFCIVFPQ